MKKISKLIRETLQLIMPAVLFTACGNVNLAAKPETQLALETKIPSGTICSRPGDLSSGLLKVVFIVDMSLSNIGEFEDAGNGKVKFHPEKGTDVDGVRFQKIKDFINNCGSNNAQNKFKIVGFSGGALKANPAQSGCQAGFSAKDLALGAVDSLKSLQDYNKANIDRTDFAPSMQMTTYQDGLECARSIVLDDIQTAPVEAKNSNYILFFVTDGKASDNCASNTAEYEFRDKYGSCCPGGAIRVQGTCCAPGVIASSVLFWSGLPLSQTCCAVGERRDEQFRCEADPNYEDKINSASNPAYESLIRETMIVGKQKASTIRIQPLFYGSSEEAGDATKLLDQMAAWGDSAKSVTLTNVNQADFCKYANSPVLTQYQASEFNVINLTAVMKDGYLRADSDVDGVPDKDDPNPTNARSNKAGLLDVICKQSSSDFDCQKPASCSLDKVHPLHLTECDLAALSIADGDGIDSDKDRIPDLIEILRGTIPSLNDSFNNLDGDALNNLAEIHLGRQTDSPDDDVASNLTSDWSLTKIASDNSCPANQQNYRIALNRIPTVPTKAYADPLDAKFPGSKFKLSHKENENVIFIYYISEPLNSGASASEFYGALLKVPHGVKDLSGLQINPQIFQKLGSIDGKPKW